ncbi:hypothetical protein GCM10027290_09060 [Micromonospora sonneratiae]|uniref:Uncharacterized protein n=1 Tax=Micromonospora sonneratiae TaxID=1184706 RepID=A0ABW3YEX5_9ACTN
MSAASTPLRVLTGSILAVLLLTGCQAIEDGSRVISRADLVNDLASRLDRATELTYSAEYQLTGGESASIAQTQEPLQAAYSYPGGKLTVSAEATTECQTAGPKPSCILDAPPAQTNRPSVTVFTNANKRGLVTPPVVIGLLTAAALDPNADIEQTDTTIAGRHATCVRVAGVDDAPTSQFNACVTAEGVLGQFTGTLDGNAVEMALSRYRNTVDGSVFELPSGATVIDQRPGTK